MESALYKCKNRIESSTGCTIPSRDVNSASSSSSADQFIPFHLPIVSYETAGSPSLAANFNDNFSGDDFDNITSDAQHLEALLTANDKTSADVDDSFSTSQVTGDASASEYNASEYNASSTFTIKNIFCTDNLMHKFTQKEIELLDQQPWISSWAVKKKKVKKCDGDDEETSAAAANKPPIRGSFNNPLIMKIRDETINVCANLSIYATGKIVCRSAKTIQESEMACRMCAQRLQHLLFSPEEEENSIRLAEFEIVHIVASFCAVEASVKLIDIVQELGELRPKGRSALASAHYATRGIPLMAYADEENDKFSCHVGATATYRVTTTVDGAMKRKEKNITSTMFSNGNATIMGATDFEQIQSIIEHVAPHSGLLPLKSANPLIFCPPT